jgi:hypothetical protein
VGASATKAYDPRYFALVMGNPKSLRASIKPFWASCHLNQLGAPKQLANSTSFSIVYYIAENIKKEHCSYTTLFALNES